MAVRDTGLVDLRGYHECLEGESTPWSLFAQRLGTLSPGTEAYGREIEVYADLGAFRVIGRIDFVLLLWNGGRPRLRLVECKASPKDRTYHRVQLVLYRLIVRQLLLQMPVTLDGEALTLEAIECVVAQQDPNTARIYLDPEEFFRKSYMTAGLGTILSRVAVALRGDSESGDRIISLQTAFGGGKTHTLVALWHLARNADRLRNSPAAEDLRRVLGGKFPEQVRSVAVFTNAMCDPTQGRLTPEGVHTHTLWGELALQLGGPALYDKVRANDEAQRVPQGLFVEVLRQAAPCLILIDELADYCVGAAGVRVGDTTLADQTISFIQQLTEAVQQVPGAVVVATLPASRYEVAQSEAGQEAFTTLEKRFHRLGADVMPVADDEIYNVVRTRLFDSITPPGEEDYPRRVADAYVAMYEAHPREVPSEAARAAYREQIERSYPFHPSLIDTLYIRWGSSPDFQRTRGVLRLLGKVIEDLWQRREGSTQTQHLIQACHIRWSIDAWQGTLTRLWGPTYRSVAAADVIGETSTSGAFDEERGSDYRREGIGRGLAAAILLGSFGGQAERAGFNGKDLRLACARLGVNWGYLDGALLELENRCFYLHSTSAGNLGKRYWFATRPNLNKLLVQYRQQFSGRDFDAEILDDLRTLSGKTGGSLAGPSWRVVVDPQPDLPEQRSLTLLVLPPSLSWNGDVVTRARVQQRVLGLSTRCGGRDRTFRNTLLFLAGTQQGLNRLRQARQEQAALEAIRADYGDQLDDEQKDDLKKRLAEAQRNYAGALGPAYTIVLRVQGQELETVTLGDARSTFPEHLNYLWTTLIEDEEWILQRVGSVTLKEAGLVPTDGGIRVKEAIEAFLRFTDKPMIATREAVTTGIVQACRDGIVGIGRGTTPTSLQARYCKETVSFDPNEDGVWIIPPFEPEPVVPAGTGTVSPGAAGCTYGGSTAPGLGSGTSTGTGGVNGGTATPDGTPGQGATIRRFVVKGSVPVESWSDVFRSFVGPAVRMNLQKLRLGIDFEMDANPDALLGADDPALKAMQEAARQLGLSFEAEE